MELLDNVHVKMGLFARNQRCRRKAIIIKYYEFACLYSWLSYPVCKLHVFCVVLCCHLWPLQLYHIFKLYLINGIILGKNYTEHKMRVLTFSKRFVRNISHSEKNSARYNHKCIWVTM